VRIINNNVTHTVNTALAIAFTAFAVVVLVTGPVVIPAAIQEAQAVKGEADEHIS
jgi:hypothetical protein